MITGIVHGNELCGAIVIDRMLREAVRPLAGVLTLVFANPEAYGRFDPADPTASRYVDEDLNRVWSPAELDGPRHSVELDRARELRPLVDESDYLLDLHSMQQDSRALTLSGTAPKGRALARKLSTPSMIVADSGHPNGQRLRDYDGFGRAGDPKTALLIECGQHWRQTTADLANQVTQRFLLTLGVIPGSAQASALAAKGEEPRCVEVTEVVTIRSREARFLQRYTGGEIIPDAGTPVLLDGGVSVRTPYDDCVLVMPARHLHRGQTAVRFGKFIECGGGNAS